MPNFPNYRQKQSGFTMVELLLVVSIIGILSAVMISVINVSKQKGTARDGVRMANVEKLVAGIESYFAAEKGLYPIDADTINVASVFRTIYVKNWPQGLDNDGKMNEAVWGYKYSQLDSGDNFVLYAKNSGGQGCYKYRSDWGKMQDCKEANCDTTANCL